MNKNKFETYKDLQPLTEKEFLFWKTWFKSDHELFLDSCYCNFTNNKVFCLDKVLTIAKAQQINEALQA